MNRILGYFKSKRSAQEALDFVASFPGNGGKSNFGIAFCHHSKAVTVVFLGEHGTTFRMNVDTMRGAVQAWNRLNAQKINAARSAAAEQAAELDKRCRMVPIK